MGFFRLYVSSLMMRPSFWHHWWYIMLDMGSQLYVRPSIHPSSSLPRHKAQAPGPSLLGGFPWLFCDSPRLLGGFPWLFCDSPRAFRRLSQTPSFLVLTTRFKGFVFFSIIFKSDQIAQSFSNAFAC